MKVAKARLSSRYVLGVGVVSAINRIDERNYEFLSRLSAVKEKKKRKLPRLPLEGGNGMLKLNTAAVSLASSCFVEPMRWGEVVRYLQTRY